MNVLLDTHALIWYIEGNKKLSTHTIEIIENTDNTIFVSKASLWEMAIKMSLEKLKLSIPFEKLEVFLDENEFSILDYTFKHLNMLLKLPFFHGDPFDRLIISQAIADDLKIITHEETFNQYAVKVLR